MRIKLLKNVQSSIYKAIIEKFKAKYPDNNLGETVMLGISNTSNKSPYPTIEKEILFLYEKSFKKIRSNQQIENFKKKFKIDHLYSLKNPKKERIADYYLECYILYLVDSPEKTSADFISSLQKLMEILLNILLDKNYINQTDYEEQSKIINESTEKHETPILYDFFYFDRNDRKIKKFEAQIYSFNRKVIIPQAPSKHIFNGTIGFANTVTLMELKNQDTENKRVLYLIVKDDHVPFSERDFSIGIYANIDERSILVCGAICIKKRKPNEAFSLNIPLSVKYYLNNKDITINVFGIKTENDLIKHLNKNYSYWKDSKEIIEQIQGAYFAYVISKEGQIFKSMAFIDQNGNIRYKFDKHRNLYGSISIFSPGILKAKLGDKATKSQITLSLKMYESNSTNYIKGIYSGIIKFSQIKGGRILLEKTSPPITESNFPQKIDLYSDKHETINKKITFFNHLFSGESDKYIESINPYDSTSQIKFPKQEYKNKEILKYISGTYEYYRISTFDPQMVKKYPIKISPNGHIRIQGDHSYSGYALIYDNLLYIHTFHSHEKRTNSPRISIAIEKKYDGLAIFKIPDIPVRENSRVFGIFLSASHNRNPIAGKLVMIKSSKPYEELEKELFDISKNTIDEIDNHIQNIALYLSSNKSYLKINDYEQQKIKTPNKKDKYLQKEHLTFCAACFWASKNNDLQALELFKKSLQEGFNDFGLLSQELNTSLVKIKVDIHKIWSKHMKNGS